MSATKHTPGPWLPSRITMKHLNIVQVGKTFRCSVVGDDNGSIVATVHGRTERECEANARLIAAAPDLLQALKDLLHAYSEPDRRLCCDGRDCGCMGSTVHQQAEHYARLAIAKAEGRSESLPLSKGQEEGNG